METARAPGRPQSLRIMPWVGAEPETFRKCYEGSCREPETVSKIHHEGGQRLRRSAHVVRGGAKSLRLSAKFTMRVHSALRHVGASLERISDPLPHDTRP